MQKSNTSIVAVFAFLFFSIRAEAAPFWEPGDAQLRHDLELVADYWRSKNLITTWPMAIDKSLLEAKNSTPLAVSVAMNRLKKRLGKANYSQHQMAAHIKVSAAKLQEPVALQTFQASPRDKGEIELGAEWSGDVFAWRLNAQAEKEPSDDKQARMDGSFVGAAVGNWAMMVSALDRWWGPGWDNSLILSNNARPVPALSLSRLEAAPFDFPLIKHLGPWNFVAFAGQLDAESSIPRTKLIGFRFTFAPADGLEIGASRTIQWGGEGRPQDGRSLFDAITGRSNVGSGGVNEDNSNQLAGFDFRWVAPFAYSNYALYGQLIGEDESGYLPSLYIGLVGLELWGTAHSSESWRLIFEHENTKASFTNESQLNIAYEHSTYTSGYRYYGRVMGASIDSDSESTKLTYLNTLLTNYMLELSARRSIINGDGNSPAISFTPRTVQTDFVVGIRSIIDNADLTFQLGTGKSEYLDSSEHNPFGNVEINYVY